ncbi:LexA family transcriptional repressor [Acinetobacter albensis]|uniref:LexA family protein n=1 Tax=Acinetobacter albensis TaxID=1673609 RepID=UPI001882240B|nr:XRE family transcriptional regulator [Acinetobacter albensis]MBE9400439.1 LexA family transcriptional repressor [Acinetobacter albensis]
MKTLSERLKHAMEVLPPKKIKGVELARAVGVKPPSVSDWLSGKSKTMEGPNLVRAAQFLKVNSKWLATGVGSPTDKESKSDFSNVSLNDTPFRKIPVLDFVQAGLFGDVAYDGINPKGETYTTYQGAKPEEVFSLTIEGMSMAPDFLPGDSIVVDASIAPQPGSFVIAQNGTSEATFKKYRVIGYDEFGREEFELVPLNPDYPTLSSREHKIAIIGVMVMHMRQYK